MIGQSRAALCMYGGQASCPSPIRVHQQNNMRLVLFKVRNNDSERLRKTDTRISTEDAGERNSNIMEVISLFPFCSESMSLTVRSLWGQTCVSSVHQALDTLCPICVCVSACVFA